MKVLPFHITLLVILIPLTFLLNVSKAFATHNRAGEITYKQIDVLTVEITLTTYTKESSVSADRDSVVIQWGDGSQNRIGRINGNGLSLPNDIKKNLYVAQHTYPGRARYIISFLDPNRIGNILNVDPPNSVDIPFYIQSEITLLNVNFQGFNNSVTLLQPPIDFACVNQLFRHNPAAYDEDGDSLVYELIVPLMDKNTPVPNYLFPNLISPGINNGIDLNTTNGTFTWNAPQKAGEYNVAFIIHEFRRGVKIASTTRDMQILVRDDCGMNHPPIISSIMDTCIVAGNVLKIPIMVSDQDSLKKGGLVKVESFGAPLILNPSAEIQFPSGFNQPTLLGELVWKTECSLVATNPYTITIKATDNYFDSTGLIDLKVIRVKIMGPPPLNLTSSSGANGILLKWDSPYSCDFDQPHFQGFSIWRKNIPNPFVIDSCITGLEKQGYQRIIYSTLSKQGNQYFFKDSTVEKGKMYCYRIQGEYAKKTSAGFLYDIVSSLPSNETCFSLSIETPILLNTDVNITSNTAGQIRIKWQKPIPNLFDTLLYPPPYRVSLQRRKADLSFEEIPGSIQNYNRFFLIQDTQYFDFPINTIDLQHAYQVQLKSFNQIFSSNIAESIFLSGSSGNSSINLNWESETPWYNYDYVVYRKNDLGQYDSIATTSQNNYTDKQSVIGDSYCYKIRSYGEYSIPEIERPLINHSNEVCVRSIDTISPCCPNLVNPNFCDIVLESDSIADILFQWTIDDEICESDIYLFQLYSITEKGETLLIEIRDPRERKVTIPINIYKNSCFRLYSMDFSKNLCKNPLTVCSKICPEYELPNTFTPNGDQRNDLFRPRKIKFIHSVDFKIVNRWGATVFETTDPMINWDGFDKNGKKLHDGVYFYKAKLNTKGEDSNFTSNISGFIELLGSNK